MDHLQITNLGRTAAKVSWEMNDVSSQFVPVLSYKVSWNGDFKKVLSGGMSVAKKTEGMVVALYHLLNACRES